MNKYYKVIYKKEPIYFKVNETGTYYYTRSSTGYIWLKDDNDQLTLEDLKNIWSTYPYYGGRLLLHSPSSNKKVTQTSPIFLFILTFTQKVNMILIEVRGNG